MSPLITTGTASATTFTVPSSRTVMFCWLQIAIDDALRILVPVSLPAALDAALRRAIASNGEVRAAYLFGSQAKREARADSDIDVGVLYRSPQAVQTTLAFEGVLEEATSREVNVVDVARASAFLALDIIRGERIFTRDAADTDRFELYVLRRAGDLLPFERQRQALIYDTRR